MINAVEMDRWMVVVLGWWFVGWMDGWMIRIHTHIYIHSLTHNFGIEGEIMNKYKKGKGRYKKN